MQSPYVCLYSERACSAYRVVVIVVVVGVGKASSSLDDLYLHGYMMPVL